MTSAYEGLTAEQSAELDAADAAGMPVTASAKNGALKIEKTPTPPAEALQGFNWAAARKAGYTDTTILTGLSDAKVLPFNLKKARAEYTDAQIVAGFSKWTPPPKEKGFLDRALDAITPSAVGAPQEAGGDPMGAGYIPPAESPKAPPLASTADNPLYANTPLNPLLVDAANKQNLKDGNLTQAGPTVARAIQQRVDPEQVKIAKARAKSIDDLPETEPPISFTGVATNMFAGGAAGLSSAAAAVASVFQAHETAATLDEFAKNWRGTAEANGGKTMIGKAANIVGSIAPILAAPEGELPQLIAMTGLFGIPAFKDTLTSKLESGQPYETALNHAVISFAINMAGPKLATDGANALFSQLAKNATPQSAAMVLKEMAKSAVTGAGFSAASTSIDKFVDEQYGQKNDNPYVDTTDMGANSLAFMFLHGASHVNNIRAERSQDATVVQQADQAKQQALDKWAEVNFNKPKAEVPFAEPVESAPVKNKGPSLADQLDAIRPLNPQVRPEEVMQAATIDDAIATANKAAASPQLDAIVERADAPLPVERIAEPVGIPDRLPPDVAPKAVEISAPVEEVKPVTPEPSVIQLGQYGKAPRSGSAIELVRNEVGGFDLYQSGRPALDFDSAEPIKYPEGTTVQDALADVKARQKELFGNSGRFYQAKGIEDAPQADKAIAPDVALGNEAKAAPEAPVKAESLIEAPEPIQSKSEPETTQLKDFALGNGQIKTFKTEKDASLFIRGNKSETKGFTPRLDNDAWVLSKEIKPQSDKQIKAQAKRDRDAVTVYPTHDSLYTAIGKLGGLSRKEAVETWGVDPSDPRPTGVFRSPTLRYSGMTKEGRELGLSIDSMGERLADLGYLPKDEHGKYDVRDFENAFRVGDEHFTSQGIERRAALSDEMRYQEEMAKYKESAQDVVDAIPELAAAPDQVAHEALQGGERLANDVDWSALHLQDDADFMRAMNLTESDINESRHQETLKSINDELASEPAPSLRQTGAESRAENSRAESRQPEIDPDDPGFSRPKEKKQAAIIEPDVTKVQSNTEDAKSLDFDKSIEHAFIDIDSIPANFMKRIKVDVEVLNDKGQIETEKVLAKKALEDIGKEMEAYDALKACVG